MVNKLQAIKLVLPHVFKWDGSKLARMLSFCHLECQLQLKCGLPVKESQWTSSKNYFILHAHPTWEGRKKSKGEKEKEGRREGGRGRRRERERTRTKEERGRVILVFQYMCPLITSHRPNHCVQRVLICRQDGAGMSVWENRGSSGKRKR